MFLRNSYENRKIYDTSDSLFLLPHFIYECVRNINHIHFKRGENCLLTDKKGLSSVTKIVLLMLFYRREIIVDIGCHYFCILCYVFSLQYFNKFFFNNSLR